MTETLESEVVSLREFDSPLDGSVLDIENKQRANLLAWRGQFSPQFVETILFNYGRKGDRVMDPFAGSGTVLLEAAALSHPAIGFEVNPAAFVLAKLYTLANLSDSIRTTAIKGTEDLLSELFPMGLPLFREPGERGDDKVSVIPLLRRSLETFQEPHRTLLEALVVSLDLQEDHVPIEALWRTWQRIRTLVANLPTCEASINVSLADARFLPVEEGSVDFVLTSPPYINVFNYHHNYRHSVELLGWKPLVVAKSEIGANRKFRQNRFLTVVQYCIDMAMALAELVRVTTKDARVVLVVGRESNVHKTAFRNGYILKRIAVEVVGMNVAQIQERKFQNKFGATIREDIIHLTPVDGARTSTTSLVAQARDLGIEVLHGSRSIVPSDRAHYLDDALTRATAVEPSTRFRATEAK